MRERIRYTLNRSQYGIDQASNCLITYDRADYTLENYVLIQDITNNTTLYNPLCEGYGGIVSNGNLILDVDISDLDEDIDMIVIIQENIEKIGIEGEATRVQEENSNLLKEILEELKINNIHLSLITGEEIRSSNKM
jgi:hypothetical protein